MPAQGRPSAAAPSLPLLPPVDDAAPFSTLFDKNGFDLQTVEATAQLADRSIFVTADGRRYLVASLEPEARDNPQHAPAYKPINPGPSPVQSPALRTAPPADAQPSAAQNFGALIRKSLRRRPVSNASSNPASPGDGRAAQSPQSPLTSLFSASPRASQVSAPPYAEPAAPVHDATAMMSHLNLNPNRFSATPLFWESDGGVQAAEALTDPYMGPRDPLSPAMGPASPVSPSAHPARQQVPYQQLPPYVQRSYSDPNIPPHMAGISGQIANFDYVNYTAQANYHVQQSRQQLNELGATGGLPSLMEMSSPMPSPRRDSEMYSPLDAVPFEEKEFVTQNPDYRAGSTLQVANQVGPDTNYVNIGRSYSSGDGFDTLTPIVVFPPIAHAPSTSSDGASTSRDCVLPGEALLFDGPVKSAQTLNAPFFQDAQLKVFRNTLTNDLRFHCKIGRESETYWIKAINAQLIPIYAYDPRFPNVVYIRDNESEKGNVYMQSSQGNGRPSGIYQFNRLKELCDFQAKLTTEKVVLDITSVKLVKLSRDSRSSDTYYTVRLQIWHEAELRRSNKSDGASIVTAGTALSGPLRDRLVASSSRLIVYLGRLGEYITLFITDDIEVKAEGQTMVKLKPRKAGSFSKKGSRWPGIKAHIERKGQFEMAGLDIHGQASNPDIDATYDLYKTFEIDFENSPSQDNFIRKWDEVMKERRAQRLRLNAIKEEMGQAVFSGTIAREIW